jgi:hypothetical protein
MMTRDDADQALTAVASGYERIATAMYTIDSHPGLAFLKGAVLSGRTLVAWQDVRARVDVLWAQFGALRGLLEAARAVRAQRSRPGDDELAELTRLLDDPVVELDAAGMPLDGASTAPTWLGRRGDGQAGWLRLTELARRMEVRCTETASLLTEVDDATTAVNAALAPVADSLRRLRHLAADIGAEQEVAEAAGAALDRLGGQALGDPLAAAQTNSMQSGLRRLAADIDATNARLAEVSRVRDEFPRRVETLRQALDELAAAEAATHRSYAVVGAKIAGPGLPAVPAAVAGLRQRLPALEAAGEPWIRRAGALAALEGDVAAATQRAAELRAAADGLLDRRAELRGRLDAYRAKAARLGYAEHPDLSTLHREAKELLYTSPCDLAAATRAVAGYQRSLAELIEERQ